MDKKLTMIIKVARADRNEKEEWMQKNFIIFLSS